MNYLKVHVPEELEAAVGYKGQARYLAMYWTPAGDEAMIDDGEVAFDGNWHAYLAFIEHPYIRPHLFGAQLGNSDEEARQILIIDRENRSLAIAEWREGHRFLIDQHGPRPEIQLSKAEWDELFKRINQGLREIKPPSHEEIMQMMHDQEAVVSSLIAALDQLVSGNQPLVN
ncbi:MAG TPA: hypothetical protein VNO14_18540 [Blastocatellia bacterium]|nr:hypothetical protein [Blastocatellia bacterium]